MNLFRPNRPSLRFSLRAMLVLITALAMLLALVQLHPARRQSRAATAMRALGGKVWMDPVGPAWLRKSLGNEYFVNVKWVRFLRVPVTDSDLRHLRACTGLRRLFIVEGDITDEGLTQLQTLTDLQILYLTNVDVTDAGLIHLKGLRNLYWLNLDGTAITDAGLDHLKELPRLWIPSVKGTRVTETGLANFRRTRRSRWLPEP